MKDNKNIAEILDKVKACSDQLDTKEKEQLRDELLAYLLFGSYHDTKISPIKTNDSLRELSKKEWDLIRKLAEQTEALYRAQRSGEQEDD